MFISRSLDLIKFAQNHGDTKGTTTVTPGTTTVTPGTETPTTAPAKVGKKGTARLKKTLVQKPSSLKRQINKLNKQLQEIMKEKNLAVETGKGYENKARALEGEVGVLKSKLDAAQRQLGEYATKRSKFFSHLGDVIKTHPYAAGGLGAGMLGAGALATYLARGAENRRK